MEQIFINELKIIQYIFILSVIKFVSIINYVKLSN